MEETHEPSYYEIALTNRQVIVAFVVLLVCLLSAFFSGVWIGRESTARAAAEQIVRNAPPKAAKQGQSLEELDFFNKAPETKGGPAQPETASAAEAPSDTTLLEDLGGEPAAAKPPETPAGESGTVAAQAAPEDAAAARREKRQRRKERQAAKAAAAAAAQGNPPPARQTAAPVQPSQAPAPVLPKGSVWIQVFSSPDRSQAESIRAKLAGGGYQAHLAPIERGGRTMYRVRVGPFPSKAEAQKVADKVRTGYKLDTWVTE